MKNKFNLGHVAKFLILVLLGYRMFQAFSHEGLRPLVHLFSLLTFAAKHLGLYFFPAPISRVVLLHPDDW
jgi:hypothetical protein